MPASFIAKDLSGNTASLPLLAEIVTFIQVQLYRAFVQPQQMLMITRCCPSLFVLLSILPLHYAAAQHDTLHVYKQRHLFTLDMAAETAGKPAFFLGFGYSVSPLKSKQYHVGLRALLHGERDESGIGSHNVTDANIVDLTNRYFFKRRSRVAPMLLFHVGVRHFEQNVYRVDKVNINPITAIIFPFILFGGDKVRTDLFASSRTGATAAVGYGAVVNFDHAYLLASVDLRTSPTFHRYQQRDRANLMLSFNVALAL